MRQKVLIQTIRHEKEGYDEDYGDLRQKVIIQTIRYEIEGYDQDIVVA